MDIWGTVLADGPRRTVEVRHDYAATPDELWDALTDPDRLARWIGPVDLSGPDYVLTFPGEATSRGSVLECEAPRHLRVTWASGGEPVSEVQATIQPTARGCTLVLVHSRLPAISGAGYGAGWQDFLGALAVELGLDRGTATHAELVPAYRTLEARQVAAVVGEEVTGWTVSIDRLLDATVADVWAACTEPDRIGRWLWPVVQWPDDPARERPLRLGDRFVLGDANMPDGQHAMEVLELDAERRIAFSWVKIGATVELTLEPTSDGTLLRLQQSATPEVFARGQLRSGPDFAAGWHSVVDGLTVLLQGHDGPPNEELWDAAFAIYAPVTVEL